VKSLKELEEIRNRALEKVDLRKESEGARRIVVGMATCGIAAGARPVLNSFMEEVAKRKLKDVTINQTGCIGVCRLEPMVEVYEPGKEKITYVKMTPEKAVQVINEHIVNGNPCIQYTIGAADK
jgi:NADP-reducing hydrogenase subunit HndB